MNEFLFKGKRKDTGEWIEGWYAPLVCNDKTIIPCIRNKNGTDKEVIPETVEQCTGLNEKVEEIKKALEYCSNHSVSDCSNVCPYDKYTRCRTELTKDSLTLINELESENERLNKSDTSKEESSIEYYNLYRDFKRENQQLKDRIAELEKENGELKEHVTEVEKGIINIAKERNKKDELASKFIDSYNDSLKQFAEKLKAKYGKSCSEYYPMLIEMTSDDIDELLKECEK